MTSKNVDLLMLLKVTGHALETELAARLAAVGVTPRAQCVLTNALAGERTQSELAELSNLDKTTMVVTMDALEKSGLAELSNLDKTTMVVTMDALEKSGLAERRLSSTDRRARIIVVTDEGREVVEKARRVVEELYDEVLGSLPAQQSAALVDGLSGLLGGRLAEKVECDNPPRRRAVRSVVH